MYTDILSVYREMSPEIESLNGRRTPAVEDKSTLDLIGDFRGCNRDKRRFYNMRVYYCQTQTVKTRIE